MLIGIETFGGLPTSTFDTRLSPSTFKYVQLQNGVYDEFRVDNDVSIEFSTAKREWDINSVFLATFDNTLEAGNVLQNDTVIEKIRFKKRLKGDLNWIFMEEVDYNNKQTLYTFTDRLAYSLDEYEYCVIPVSQGIEGEPNVDVVKCEFDGLWLVDRDNSSKMYYNLDYGNVTHNRNINVIEVLERAYPVVQSSPLNYRSGSNTAVIMDTDSYHKNGKIDYLSDRKLVDDTIAFLGNRKPKMFKDSCGRKYIIMITKVDESPKSGFLGGLHTIDFEWTQIGDANSFDNLIDSGLLPSYLNE